MPPRVLRLSAPSTLVSARAFEEAFTSGLVDYLDIDVVPAGRAFDDVLGPIGRARSKDDAGARLRANVGSTDFVCLDYQAFHLLPMLATLRNRAALRARLLVIAHAPATYPVDWALLRLLLRPGDRIIAPTERARGVIEALCPELSQWVRVVPHPVHPGTYHAPRRTGLLFLGRVNEGKVLHRVLDAMALMGSTSPTLDIVGPAGPAGPAGDAPSPYARTLIARRDRLGLGEQVRFHGAVEGAAKARLLAEAGVLVNLSTTLEESFGKSVAEGLANGAPALVTDWDGLPEVALPCGTTVPVRRRSLAVDVEPSDVAEALERLLTRPPHPDSCRESARRFHPEIVGPRYRDVLREALEERDRDGVEADDGPGSDEPAAPVTGLLAGAAPLTGYSWRELYDAVVEESDELRRALTGVPTGPLTEAGEVRTRLFYGLRRSLEQVFAGFEPDPAEPRHAATSPRPAGTGFLDRVERAVDTASIVGSRVVCLQLLWSRGRHRAVREQLARLRSDGVDVPGTHYLEVESLAQRGRLTEALDLCLAPPDAGWWDEHASSRLAQLATIATRAGSFDLALPRLRRWTECYPDAPAAGAVWLALAQCAGGAGLGDECIAALRVAQSLLGEECAPVVVALLAGLER